MMLQNCYLFLVYCVFVFCFLFWGTPRVTARRPASSRVEAEATLDQGGFVGLLGPYGSMGG